jgi:hypothetical protein
MGNIRASMYRRAFDFVTEPVDLGDLDITVRWTPGDITRVREMPSFLGPHFTSRTAKGRPLGCSPILWLTLSRDSPLA